MNKSNDTIRSIEEQLSSMGLNSMADTLDSEYHSKEFADTDFLTLLSRIVESEYQERINRRLRTHLRTAHLQGSPQELSKCVDSRDREYLPKNITATLSTLNFINDGLNICILGPSDSGKSYLAKALGIEACLKYKVGYFHCETFLEEMVSLMQCDYAKYQRRMKQHINKELLILDDFLLHTLTDEREIKVLYELMEQRNVLCRSTIVCSQREPNSWASMMLNDEVSANSIVKRATKHYTVVINPKEE